MDYDGFKKGSIEVIYYEKYAKVEIFGEKEVLFIDIEI